MFKIMVIVLMAMLVSCGGGVAQPDPGDNDPPLKTMGGDWQFAARGEVPDGWPDDFTMNIYGGKNGATFTVPEVIGDSLRSTDVTLRIQGFTETDTWVLYDSDDTFETPTKLVNYVTFDYYKTGPGDYLTFKYPLRDTWVENTDDHGSGYAELVQIVYDAAKL